MPDCQVTVLDTGVGNLFSITRALTVAGAESVVVTSEAATLEAADRLVLPGVGSFLDVMATMRSLGLDESIRSAATRGIPILGICLGMQILCTFGTEGGPCRGLGVFPARVVEMERTDLPSRSRLPHIGWSMVDIESCSWVGRSANSKNDLAFYFAHSYHVVCEEPSDVSAYVNYGESRLVAAIRRGKRLCGSVSPGTEWLRGH